MQQCKFYAVADTWMYGLMHFNFDVFNSRLFPRALSTSKNIYRCLEVQRESFVNSNLCRKSVVSGCPFGAFNALSLFSKQPFKRYSLPLGALLTSITQDAPIPSLISDEKVGVLLLNLGGPETLDDVQPFLFNLFADPVNFCLIICFLGQFYMMDSPLLIRWIRLIIQWKNICKCY